MGKKSIERWTEIVVVWPFHGNSRAHPFLRVEEVEIFTSASAGGEIRVILLDRGHSTQERALKVVEERFEKFRQHNPGTLQSMTISDRIPADGGRRKVLTFSFGWSAGQSAERKGAQFVYAVFDIVQLQWVPKINTVQVRITAYVNHNGTVVGAAEHAQRLLGEALRAGRWVWLQWKEAAAS